jgi:hypothetical protein
MRNRARRNAHAETLHEGDNSKINLGVHGALNDSADGVANLIRKFAQV